ncbi:hypothetical protein Tsubulata_036783 [Turnera subulata]|uniref:DUF4283 domain-containing protein n=1 Tax=Turnera subulata TaxID=218843 RepID=A0A9Q0EYN4_9ROSI|nr:hypothetical protein Tsubulata_036783 [Turnera subulata]
MRLGWIRWGKLEEERRGSWNRRAEGGRRSCLATGNGERGIRRGNEEEEKKRKKEGMDDEGRKQKKERKRRDRCDSVGEYRSDGVEASPETRQRETRKKRLRGYLEYCGNNMGILVHNFESTARGLGGRALEVDFESADFPGLVGLESSPSRRVIELGGGTLVTEDPSPEESLGAIVARTYVVGKVLGDRRPHISQIRSQMQNVWYNKGDFRIIPKMNNIFLIGFELEEDKKKVLEGSPWLISNMHFCLRGWFPDMILSQVSFRQVLFWVQLHDIPPNLLSHDRVVKIGVVFPVFHFYEPTLKIRRAMKFGLIRFQYERLGELCVRCGKITLLTNRCTKPSLLKKGTQRPTEDSYGPWMRAKEVLGNYYSARKPIPIEEADRRVDMDPQLDQGANQMEAPLPEIQEPRATTRSKKRKLT